jgi:hypothetical protein
MKTLSGILRYVSIAIGVMALAGACATYVKSKSGLETGQIYATIYPEAKVSSDDCNALNRVLKRYHKSLYQIRTYSNGKLVKIQGNISQKFIRKGLVSEVDKNAHTTNFSGCAIQAGSTNELPTVTPPIGGKVGSTTRQTMIPMVNELRPILEKYNKK